MNIIKFFKLLIYHIYLHFYKTDDGNKALAKFSTFLIFTLIFGVILYFAYELISISFNDVIIFETPYWQYIFLYLIVGIFVGKYIYSESFEKFDSFRDYHVKYYFYFFLIAGFALGLAFYSAGINRERISKQKEMQKTSIEMKK